MSGWLRVAVLALGLFTGAGAVQAGGASVTDTFINAIRASRDANGKPFAVVDKLGATLYVFGADGRLVGKTAALLGLAAGDSDRPDVRARLNSGTLSAADRITPAGRFDTVPGQNLQGDRVIWVDYHAALAIHRLRPAPAGEQRPERLASATPADNRITLGCVVVAGSFFDSVVLPTLGQGAAVVYVMPEKAETLARWLPLLGAESRPD